VRLAQGLLALLGAVVLFGSIYFSVIEPPKDVVGVDWAVAAWALGIALAALASVPRLGRPEPGARRFVMALLAVHLVFGLVKLVGYDEPEAATFMAVDVLILGLLASGPARRYADG
jgi:hypothetical protein